MSYTDMTAEFDYKDLLKYQNMDLLADNDDYDDIESGTVAAFFMANAPTGWRKQTSIDDSFIRIVSGNGGGSGGSTGISPGVTLQHSHTVNSHTHSNAHQHELDHGTDNTTSNLKIVATDASAIIYTTTTGSTSLRHLKNNTLAGEGGNTGSASPSMDTQLTDLAYKYVDVIVCTKD